jgi:hypothetical protein
MIPTPANPSTRIAGAQIKSRNPIGFYRFSSLVIGIFCRNARKIKNRGHA